ncbi:MAG: DUF3842 family protein [bacterium]
MIKIAVIDGQGGGIGNLVVKALRDTFGDSIEVIALGTNASATAAMMKARADKGATGENAISFNASRVDVIVGPLSILMPNGMLGELSPKMAEAISVCSARKILLPLNQEKVAVVGVEREPLPHLIERLIAELKPLIHEEARYV